jgi:hypothetical protein
MYQIHNFHGWERHQRVDFITSRELNQSLNWIRALLRFLALSSGNASLTFSSCATTIGDGRGGMSGCHAALFFQRLGEFTRSDLWIGF